MMKLYILSLVITTTDEGSSQLLKCLVKSKPLATDFCENYVRASDATYVAGQASLK